MLSTSFVVKKLTFPNIAYITVCIMNLTLFFEFLFICTCVRNCCERGIIGVFQFRGFLIRRKPDKMFVDCCNVVI